MKVKCCLPADPVQTQDSQAVPRVWWAVRGEPGSCCLCSLVWSQRSGTCRHTAARWRWWQWWWSCPGWEQLGCSPWSGILGRPRLLAPPRAPWAGYLQAAAGGWGKASGSPPLWSLTWTPMREDACDVCFFFFNPFKVTLMETYLQTPPLQNLVQRRSLCAHHTTFSLASEWKDIKSHIYVLLGFITLILEPGELKMLKAYKK